MHRFYVQEELSIGEVSIESLSLVHQLTKVLRMRPGETVIFFNGGGFNFEAEVLFFAKESVRVSITKKIKSQHEARLKMTLCHALVKKDAMEWVFEKGTEVGVSVFQPMITSRTIQKEIHAERGKKIIKEAAEQSGRTLIPELRETKAFTELIKEATRGGSMAMLFDPMGEKVASEELSQIFVRAKKKSVTIFIGPEGGFTDEERVRAREEGCTVLAGLPSVLRAETAAIVFPAILGFLSNS